MILKGKLVDTSGEPLMGANIFHKSGKGTFGATSDYDGKFEFEIEETQKTYPITISYLGFKNQVFQPSELDGRTITMEEEFEQLGEVVITATKPTPKKKLDTEKLIMYGSLGLVGLSAIILAVTLIKRKNGK